MSVWLRFGIYVGSLLGNDQGVGMTLGPSKGPIETSVTSHVTVRLLLGTAMAVRFDPGQDMLQVKL